MQNSARRAAAPVFAIALFFSASLIFVLQPLFGRLVTPLLGGSPAVWNTSMAFFQAALLVGYLYAHLLARMKDLRLQAAIHALVLVGAFLFLPVRVTELFGPPSSEHPALWLIGVLALSVGAPFAAASATAPLLQSWYARTGRADAHDPYYLYAASNAGSFVGLLAYPVIIEPLLGLQAQSIAWTSAYGIAAALIALAAATAMASGGKPPAATPTDAEHATWKQRLYWMAAAAAPSALILGVTLHISTDVASAPMLWVVPLALYLATFVIAFARGAERFAPVANFIHPIALALLVFSYFSSSDWAVTLSGNLVGFFVSALVCHYALARTRPHAGRLTEFYFWVSLGGVVGGAFAAFAAPVIFNDVYEYPLALAATALFRPRGEMAFLSRWRFADVSAGAAVLMAGVAMMLMRWEAHEVIAISGAIGVAGALLAAGWEGEGRPRTHRIAFTVVAGLMAVLMLAVLLNLGAVFTFSDEKETPSLGIAQPWNLLLLAGSFLTLAFSVHAAAQPRRDGSRIADLAAGASIPTFVLIILLILMRENLNAHTIAAVGMLCAGIALFCNGGRPFVMAGLVLVAFVIIFVDDRRGGTIITQERSFFGVLRTRVFADQVDPEIPALRVLMHGTTIHGAQLVAPGFTQTPLTYYNPNTALGEAILAGLSTNENDASKLALIGLGTGSTACLMRREDQLTIYEIDPEVVRLAAEPGGDFSYVQECQPDARVDLGDARLRIADAPDGAYDVIVVDAFSSDAIPAHLLTREAIALYLRKTSDNGIVVLHLSNRNLALVSEAARVARDLGAPTLFRVSGAIENAPGGYYGGLPASVMIVARSPEAIALLPVMSEWRVIEAPPGRAWSDDYINMPRALWESLNGREECITYPYLKRCGGGGAVDPATGATD